MSRRASSSGNSRAEQHTGRVCCRGRARYQTGSRVKLVATTCGSKSEAPAQKHCLDQNAMHIKWRHRHARVFGRNAHGAGMSGLNHSLNCVRLRSSLRHACMAFSHARLVSDMSSGEGGNEACNAARRSGSALSKYAQKEPDSHMSCQAWYSLVRQIASTPAARCITRRPQSVAGAIGSSHTCAAATG